MRTHGLGTIAAIVVWGAWPSSASADGAPSSASSEWKFDWHGYFRAPLRLGVGHRPECPPGAQAPTTNPATSPAIVPETAPPISASYTGQYCAMPGQGRTTIHSPYVPDDQYYAWTYDRQWEQAWAELYLSYGNDRVVGTVELQAYDFTDTTLLGNQADPAQFGFGQAWVTVTPELPVSGLAVNWKVGAFSEKFGTASMNEAKTNDSGPYDTYMFGRTHQMGESLALEYETGDWALRVEHGFGAHLEQVPAGISLSGSGFALSYAGSAAQQKYQLGVRYPPGPSAGVTLLNHAHVGVEWKKRLRLSGHYLVAWSQDDRVQGTLDGNGNPTGPDGSMSVLGGEARFLGGFLGELYAGYSHIDTKNVAAVGPAIEVLHSAGGGGHNGVNGIYDNFYNSSGDGDGHVDSVQLGYDLSFGALLRALRHAPPTVAAPDVRLSLFAMASSVVADPTSHSPYPNHRATDGTLKLKYGADLAASPLPWLGFALRADYEAPDSHDPYQSFAVLSPRILFRTAFITHEEIALQYSHYWTGVDVLPQQYLAETGNRFIGASFAQLYPNDADVFGIKCSFVW